MINPVNINVNRVNPPRSINLAYLDARINVTPHNITNKPKLTIDPANPFNISFVFPLNPPNAPAILIAKSVPPINVAINNDNIPANFKRFPTSIIGINNEPIINVKPLNITNLPKSLPISNALEIPVANK